MMNIKNLMSHAEKKSKGRLYGSVVYQSGPMDCVKDWSDATGWRDFVKKELWSRGIGVIDPCDKPTLIPEDEEFRAKRDKLRESGDVIGVHEMMSKVVKEDMRFVDLAHFIILYIDMYVFMCGSFMESCLASGYQKKPVLTMCKQGVNNLPYWWAGVNPPEMNFNTWKDLLDYIDFVNDPTSIPEELNRWRFIDMEKVYGITSRS